MAKPDWTREELILALDVYFREPTARGSKSHPAVHDLSRILNQLSIHGVNDRAADFRNPNGVGMKLANFLRFDPSYKGRGLQRGGQLEKEIWDVFSTDLPRLRQAAAAIRANLNSPDLVASPATIEDPDEEAEEGALLTRVHRARERNQRIIRSKKHATMKATGKLMCEACGFEFQEAYGELGQGFAECHHRLPVSALRI